MELPRNESAFLDAIGADSKPDPTTAGEVDSRFRFIIACEAHGSFDFPKSELGLEAHFEMRITGCDADTDADRGQQTRLVTATTMIAIE